MNRRLPVATSMTRGAGRAPLRRRVALVCTPFQAIALPSIALGTLAELLRVEGHAVDVVHLNLDFASRIGLAKYEELVSYAAWLRLFGEWLFADERIAPGAASVAEYRQHLERHRWRERARQLERLDLVALKAEANRSVERWFRARDWGAYDVVGFNVMFQQLNPSLRLGLRIKRAHPGVRIVLGGSALEAPMGQPVLDRHAWLDAVFSGYAELTFPAYVAELPARAPRVIRQNARVGMDELPIPDYGEFFAELGRAGLEGTSDFCVPIETSRGCWWGERQHCTFCGLNALDMTQRNKSAARVIAEIRAQARYGRPFFATDNILPLEFFDDLFARLLEHDIRFDTFYETKANLSLAQLRTLKRAGVNCIQPGIESLSTPILREMKKGVSAAQNVWLLRAAEELGLGIAWSILYGFPAEDPAEYARMAGMLPALAHLSPPLRPAPVLLERYSPLFERASSFGLRDLRPTPAHRAAFGDAPALGERAYVFDFEYGDGRQPDVYTEQLNRQVLAWRRARRGLFAPRCEVFRVGRLRLAVDTRAKRRTGRGWPELRLLDDAEWALVRLTEELTTEPRLKRAWSGAEPLEPLIADFLRRRWLLRLDGRLVRILLTRDEPYIGAELKRAARGGGRLLRFVWRRSLRYLRTRIA